MQMSPSAPLLPLPAPPQVRPDAITKKEKGGGGGGGGGGLGGWCGGAHNFCNPSTRAPTLPPPISLSKDQAKWLV